MSKHFYVTTPIYYPNSDPHIGSAYTTLACDVLARFKRLDGYKVFFLTGTDEHGQKLQKAAEAAGLTPQDFVDKTSQRFRDLIPLLNFTPDDFIRTTEPRHKAAATAMWQAMAKAGTIYEGKYSGWYSVRDETFYSDSELVDGKAPTGAPVEWVEESSFFFRLSAFQDKLLEYYAAHPDFIAPTARRNEVLSFVKGGLQDLSISRTTFTWGVPVPNQPQHVMYVWVDALTNYLTAIGYPNTSSPDFAPLWHNCLHIVGKDILRFHAVIWPAMLMAAGLPLPARVFAHGWWTVDGQKMSKSLGNVIAPADLVAQYGVDPVRYFLLREVSFGNDGDFSHHAMQRRLNVDLANDLGNLAQRVLAFIQKNAGGAMPIAATLQDADKVVLTAAQALLPQVRAWLETQEFHRALEAIGQVVVLGNQYVDTQAPWSLKKADPNRMATVLWVLVETLRRVALLLQAFMPTTMAQLLDFLAVPQDARRLADYERSIPSGTNFPTPQPLFAKVEHGEKS